MYDQNKLSPAQLKKIGQTPATAKRLTPPKRRTTTHDHELNWARDYQRAWRSLE
jgi:hypothetical protein